MYIWIFLVHNIPFIYISFQAPLWCAPHQCCRNYTTFVYMTFKRVKLTFFSSRNAPLSVMIWRLGRLLAVKLDTFMWRVVGTFYFYFHGIISSISDTVSQWLFQDPLVITSPGLVDELEVKFPVYWTKERNRWVEHPQQDGALKLQLKQFHSTTALQNSQIMAIRSHPTISKMKFASLQAGSIFYRIKWPKDLLL